MLLTVVYKCVHTYLKNDYWVLSTYKAMLRDYVKDFADSRLSRLKIKEQKKQNKKILELSQIHPDFFFFSKL